MNETTRMNSSFLWGASSSGFQCEGAWDLDGKAPATTDMRQVPEGVADNHIASDHYHHMEEDIALMKDMGMKVYRFAFQWSRIMGEGDAPNPAGIAFYESLINECLANGIEPFPTLYHFEMPQSLVDRYGGWKSRKCIDDFVRYAKTCFETFGDRVKMWGTINEQLIACSASDLNGNKEKDPHQKLRDMYQMAYNMSLAEKKVIRLFHEMVPDGKIGPVCSMQVVYPETPSPDDILAARDAQDFLQNMYLDMSVFGTWPQSVKNYLHKKDLFPETKPEDEAILKADQPDLIGVNYYASTCIRARRPEDDVFHLPPFYRNELFTLGTNDYLPKTKWMEFGIDPQGLYTGIRDIYERYHLPVIVTENGLAVSEQPTDGRIHDSYRIDYLREHIRQVKKLSLEGYPVLGYCTWSFMDLVSSHQGFAKRYGLVYVNRTDTDIKDCARIPKDSYYWYQGVIARGGLEEAIS